MFHVNRLARSRNERSTGSFSRQFPRSVEPEEVELGEEYRASSFFILGLRVGRESRGVRGRSGTGPEGRTRTIRGDSARDEGENPRELARLFEIKVGVELPDMRDREGVISRGEYSFSRSGMAARPCGADWDTCQSRRANSKKGEEATELKTEGPRIPRGASSSSKSPIELPASLR